MDTMHVGAASPRLRREFWLDAPARHWRRYGTDPLPTGAEALDEPFAAFPSWSLRTECDRCGKVRMISETHIPVPAVSRPVRRIVLREGDAARRLRPQQVGCTDG